MRIGLVTHYMPPHNGGIERVAEMLFTAYTQRGFDVRWVASRDPADAPAREGDRIRVACWNGLERRLQIPVPLWGFQACREVAALARWADVLHVHDCLYPGSVLGLLFGRWMGRPVLLSQHVGLRGFATPALDGLARAAYATLGRSVLRGASRLVLVTPAAEAFVTALLRGYPANACAIRNGVDTGRFRPSTPETRRSARARLGLVPEGNVVLFVGRLVEQKGVRLLLEVVRRLPGAHFLVVGDGPLADAVPNVPNLTWLRFVPPEQIHTCYQASDCLLLPSHGEGLPLVVQEAAASGLGIVISEGESYSGPLIEQHACVASQRTPDAMAEALRGILSRQRPEMGARARAYAEAHWSVDSMMDRYVALLEEMYDPLGSRKQLVLAGKG